MSGLTARPFHALFSATVKQKPVCVSSSCAVLEARLRVGKNCCWSGTRTRDSHGKGLVVVAKAFRGSRKQLVDPSALDEAVDPALDINSIRSPSVRLIDEEQKMVGIVSTSKAIEMAEDAELDLVIISRNGDPPVVRLVDYSKYKFEQQKRKRDQQKRSTGSHTDVKELKMGCNIDIHDYNVRLRAAQKFLQDGRKVKFIVQCRGRELNFRGKTMDIFERFQNDLKELGVLEAKTYGERYMFIVLQSIKRVVKGPARSFNTKKSDVKPVADEEQMTKEEPVIEEKSMTEVSSGV